MFASSFEEAITNNINTSGTNDSAFDHFYTFEDPQLPGSPIIISTTIEFSEAMKAWVIKFNALGNVETDKEKIEVWFDGHLAPTLSEHDGPGFEITST